MPFRIAFRADASSNIGAGHVVRCATLADPLRQRGAEIRFFCRELPGHACDWLESRGYAVHRLPAANCNQDGDAQATRSALADFHPDWLVVDHYEFDATWESALRPVVARILAIDDLANRPHHCDLLLDQNFRLGTDNPYGSLAPAARPLLGPRYALLRPEFLAARKLSRERDGSIGRVLVCFGGADPHNHTAAALAALEPHLARLDSVTVVLGAANLHLQTITDLCQGQAKIRLVCQASDMAALLAEADLAIGAGGIMNWERACLGVPTLAFGIAENQRPGLEALLEAGLVLGEVDQPWPDPAAMAAWLACALSCPALLRGLSRRSSGLVDGRGAERVADAMLPAPLAFRPATLADSEAIYRWRNHPAVRSISLDRREIPWADHQAWLEGTLANPRRVLLVAEEDGKPVGVVRFDLEGANATISVYRVPDALAGRGGLIRQATAWLRQYHPEVRHIVAEVLPGNHVSLAAFRDAGYRDAKNVLAIELEKS